MTGDTDLAPAVRTAVRLTNNDDIYFAFPHNRKNKELAQITEKSFQMKIKSYQRHQLPDPYTLRDGTLINKPLAWY